MEFGDNQTANFCCVECGGLFSTLPGLKQHMHVHSSVKPFICGICNKAYAQLSGLCRHRRSHMTNSKPSANDKESNEKGPEIKCCACLQIFKTQKQLNKHRTMCSGDKTRTLSSSVDARVFQSSDVDFETIMFDPKDSLLVIETIYGLDFVILN